MNKEYLYAWFKEGTVSIPAFLLTHYKTMGLNEQELVLVLQLQSFIDHGNDFPAPSQMAERMTLPESECLFLIQRLVQRGFVQMAVENNGEIGQEKYSLSPLYEKMLDCFMKSMKQAESAEAIKAGESLYTIFEQEFGRPLSPFECETLAMWMEDDHSPEIIKSALREAVISGKLNFRYIDRILFEWKRNGIKTLEQARQQSQKFRAHQKRERKAEPAPNLKDVPLYNWLEQ